MLCRIKQSSVGWGDEGTPTQHGKLLGNVGVRTSPQPMLLKRTLFRQRGVAAVEFALILPFLLILSFITIEVGRALFQYNTLTKAVRDGARYVAMHTPGDAAKETIAKNLVVYGNAAGTGTPLAIGLATNQVSIAWSLQGSSPVINTVKVSISNYTFVPLIGNAFGFQIFPDAGVIFAPISATMRGVL